jgi:hypothetical protein
MEENALKQAAALVLCVMTCLSPVSSADIQSNRHHDKEFWKQIAHNDYRVPPGESAATLIMELSDELGSPDSELRDGLAYEISATWIYNGLLTSEEIHPLLRKCEKNLGIGLGEQGTDTILLRSFSALELSVIAALDTKKPFLSDDEFEQLLASAVSYMNKERDLRGYDPQTGWMHATAHDADLLKFLGRNTHLKPTDQVKILDTIGKKTGQDGHVFVFCENERMAAAVLSLIRRKDFDQQSFGSWLAHFPTQSEALWATPQLNLAEFAAVQNSKDLLRSLLVQLYLIDQPEANVESAKTMVLNCLKQIR